MTAAALLVGVVAVLGWCVSAFGDPFTLHHINRAPHRLTPQSPRMIPMRRRGPEVRAALARGQDVHFDYTDGDCSENSTVVVQCNDLYEEAVTYSSQRGTYTDEVECSLMTETIACIETALCHCNFSADHPELEYGYRSTMILYHYYNNITDCANDTSGETIQSDVMGPIDVTEGVNCSQYNRTAGDLSLSLAVAQLPWVQDVEDICPGVQSCYYQYDQDLAVALYRKHWPEYCLVSVELLECVVNMTCECGQSTHVLVVDMIATERAIYRESCDTIHGTTQEISLTCPGSYLCDSDNPQYNCLQEFKAAYNAVSNLTDYCRALYELANCTEELACECGFYQQPGYYRSLAVTKHNYVTYNCPAEYGMFPNHTGLNCGVDNRFTEAEKILSISLAEPAFVAAEEARCPGIQHCYDIANAKSTEAHMMKDLTVICQTESERIQCVEQAYCDCGHLNDVEVYTRLSGERQSHGILCYSATEFVPLTRCRGVSTCRQSDPHVVCLAEYNYDYEMAGKNYQLRCQAVKDYITCTEEVGCACGLLDDGASLEAEMVYNTSTVIRKSYNEAGCPRLTGDLLPQTEGIQCADQPDQSTRRRLVLSYADSSEVAALAGGCEEVRVCFKTNDQSRGQALWNRDYNKLCQAQLALILCVDGAYCRCGMNGTHTAENYMNTEIRSHSYLCSDTEAVDRKACNRPTGSAGRLTIHFGLLVIILTSVIMTSQATW